MQIRIATDWQCEYVFVLHKVVRLYYFAECIGRHVRTDCPVIQWDTATAPDSASDTRDVSLYRLSRSCDHAGATNKERPAIAGLF